MLRKALTILSLVGLLLSVAAWGVSYLRIGHDGKHLLILLYAGAIECERIPGENDTVEWLYFGFHNFGTIWDSQFDFAGIHCWRILIPLWIPATAFGVLLLCCRPPYFYCRRKRKKLGLCVKCGYDLRASKDRCPECGTGFSS